MLELDIEKYEEEIYGTIVKLKDIENFPLFRLNFDQLKYVLRTRTALGNTKSIWEQEKEISIRLNYTDQNGNEHNDELKNNYFLLYRELLDKDSINLDDFIQYATEADRTDLDKRNKLKNKIIFKEGIFKYSDQREIKYTSFFLPKRKLWSELSMQFGLAESEDLKNDKWLDNFSYTLLSSGIYTSVKGMPTGISIEHPTTGYSGYWSNIFILFEDRSLKFDIGRKSIHGMQARLYREYARDIFQNFLKYVTKYVSGEVKVDTEWDRDDIFAEIEKIPPLMSNLTKFEKSPKDQEASVAGIFFECIGKDIIKDIKPLTSGYRNKYDLYAKWGNKKVIIEFKSRLRNVVKDFNDERKMFDEMNAIVCWDVSEEDTQEFMSRGIELEKLETGGLLDDSNDNFPNSTHKLILSGYIKPIYVIDLKVVLNA